MGSIQAINNVGADEVSRRLELLCKKLDSPNEILLPTDYPRPVPLKVVEATEEFILPQNLSMAVLQLILFNQNLSNASNTTSAHPDDVSATPFTVLLTAFVVLLYRFTASEDIVVGTSSESSNPLVLRLKVSPTDSFLDVMQNVKNIEREAYENQVPFEDLIKAVAQQLTDKGLAKASDAENAALYSLFRVRFFNAMDTTESVLRQTISQSTDLTVFISQESTISLRQLAPSIKLRFVYNQVLFTKIRIQHLWEQLQKVLLAASHATTSQSATKYNVGTMDLLSELDRNVIPNPESDMHWSQFPGSITEIFCKNATAHPERPLITEFINKSDINSKKLISQKIIYSYSQMYKASRIISRYLRSNGVVTGDVVVVYAYRGADLLISVMGVLMAGATFSVIDPAYPPARQNIYLSVAKPKAIIVLDKAGKLHPDVLNYIDNELDIACKLDAIALDDNGVLTSKISDLTHVCSLVEQSTDPMDDVVSVGPDSVGTLSFTSGSTGIPKGVQGRHFSLTHFYPWMSQEFNITNNDRFTMLSGIAHDPIQRDIFTPIFFGAELIIPTSEDIGIPGQLAKWMSENHITVTHLTPAMGQLLSSNAISTICTLKNAFFVGDLLTRRDCTRIQSIAPNCRIVNMYGTTETQRAVSYYSIPSLSSNPASLLSMKEIIPAGKGMVDVQLLVVNIHDRNNICSVGEVGEIYVRSSGLAEGYLRLEDATKEKFVNNWFSNVNLQNELPEYQKNLKFLGPRDRLYRTGDLGRYMPDGNVECIGRIDDQVKIRGFRIELGEINNILSLFPQLVSSVVLVRRDKNEEQTLVAYIVPDEKEQKRTDDPSRSQLITSIRDYLKQKLPSYSIPAVFVPMKKLPLTPNGKIDKAALPYPDTPLFRTSKVQTNENSSNSQYSNISKELGNTGHKLLKIWLDLLNLPASAQITKESNFFDLGGHSILATRMVFRIRKELAEDAPLGIVYQSPSLQEMTIAIDDLINDMKLSNPLQKISNNGSPVLIGSTVNLQGLSLKDKEHSQTDYATDLELLCKQIPELSNSSEFQFPIQTNSETTNSRQPKFLLTGATGFLGAYVLSSLLKRHPRAIVYCLTRAKCKNTAMERVKHAAKANLVWQDSWEQNNQVIAVVGDLALPKLGMDESVWNQMTNEIDVIVHNGALVNWVWPYEKLRSPNVLGTIEALKLASINHIKPLVFVSSTSALDTPHYVRVGDSRASGVSEDDNLEGSRIGLRSGYGQSKWVSEKLLFKAKSMGYPVSIVRPGYVIGDTKNGVTNTDDFIWRLVKGCLELRASPEMNNVVNLCPVDYVAQVVVEAASLPISLKHLVYHVFNKQQFKFKDLFSLVSEYGYTLPGTEYIKWRDNLLEYTTSSTQDNALFPLLHFVMDDLPTSTRAPELDISNTTELMQSINVTCPDVANLMGLYLAYLAKAQFLPLPDQ
ncbi:hypothetical protein BB561_004937, partial [Smittium simulii]